MLSVAVRGCLCLSVAVPNKCHIFACSPGTKLSVRIRIVREPGLHGLHDSGPLPAASMQLVMQLVLQLACSWCCYRVLLSLQHEDLHIT